MPQVSLAVKMDMVHRTAGNMQHARAGCKRFAHMVGESRYHLLSSYCTDACQPAVSEDIFFVEFWLLQPVLMKGIHEGWRERQEVYIHVRDFILCRTTSTVKACHRIVSPPMDSSLFASILTLFQLFLMFDIILLFFGFALFPQLHLLLHC